jgi:phospholipid transport system transporter-binding protein
MTVALINRHSEKHCVLEGVLDFESVVPLLQEGKQLIDSTDELRIDLHRILHANSAGVALLVAWYQYARHQQKCLHFVNLPAQVKTILQISGLSRIIQES